MPKVSVIVPIYNTEKYLEKCLTSILTQSLDDLEIILIDDASTDKSSEIMQAFYQQNPNKIKILSNITNSGPGKSRNKGLEIAKGEYISFIDSDDYIASDMLEKMYLGCKKTHAEIARVNLKRIFKNYEVNFVGRNTTFTSSRVIKPKKDPTYLIKEYPGCTNKLFNHNFIAKKRFPEHLKWEDLPFTIPILTEASSIITIPDSKYYYNINFKGTTCKDSKKLSANILDIFDCADIVGATCLTENTPNHIKRQIELIQKQNCLQRLRDVLCSNISYHEKKELITLLSNLIDLKYGSWQQDSLYQEYKQSRNLYNLRMNIIERYFLKDQEYNLSEQELKAKIKSKIKV